MQWARRHFIWRRADWNRVLFSDESSFPLSFLMAELGFIAAHRAVYGLLRAEKGSIWWGQFNGLGWDNGWPEDGHDCNAISLNACRYIDDV